MFLHVCTCKYIIILTKNKTSPSVRTLHGITWEARATNHQSMHKKELFITEALPNCAPGSNIISLYRLLGAVCAFPKHYFNASLANL